MPAWTRKFLPSWRFIVVLLAGIAAAIGAYSLAGIEARDGRSPSQVTVVDDEGYFEAGAVEKAVQETVWGRPVRILVYVGPETSEPGVCDDRVRYCLPHLSSHVAGNRLVADAVVMWINTDRGFVSIDNGNVPFVASETTDERWDLGETLSYVLRTDEVKPAQVANALQVVSDADSDATTTPRAVKWILAIIAGTVVMILVSLGLAAWSQWRRSRRRGGDVARMSRKERRDLVARVRDVYTEASTSLDEMRLIATAHKKEPSIATRVAQWETRYTDFARTMFSISDDEDLSKLRQSGLLSRLSRQATLVADGMAQLKADDAWLNKRADEHPAPAMLTRAIDAVDELAVANSDTQLASLIPGWRRQVEREIGWAAQLRDWDDVARQIAVSTEAALTKYRTTHDREFEGRQVIEDAARIRSLEKLKPGQRRNRKPRVTSQELRDVMRRAQASEVNRRQVRLPVSPALIVLAAVASIVLGSFVAASTTPREDHIESGIATAPGITPELLGDVPAAAAHEIPVEDDGEELFYPEVTFEDEAELFDHDVVRDGLAKVPFPFPTEIVILTTNTRLNDAEFGLDRLDLADEFPDYWNVADYDGTRDFAYPKAADLSSEWGRIVLWYADGGNQRGVVHQKPMGYEHDSTGLFADDALESDGVSYEVMAWNAIVLYSNSFRGIDISSSGSTITTGSSSVQRGLIAGSIAFPLIVALASFGAIPFRRARQSRAWADEYETTMSALSLGHDALKLEMNYVDSKFFNYPAGERWEAWDAAYAKVVRSTKYGEDTRDHRELEKRVTAARILRAQAQSLWRIRPILESSPGWAAHWDDEVALIYATHGQSGDNLASELIRVSQGISSGSLKPMAGLVSLDTLSHEDRNVAALRCLGGEVDEDVVASSGALSLFSNADEVARHSYDPSFSFSFHTGAWELIKSLAAAMFESNWAPKAVGIGFVLIFAYSPSFAPDRSLSYDDDRTRYEEPRAGQPASVTVLDEGDILDEARVQEALEAMEWGAQADIIVFTMQQECEWDYSQSEVPFEAAPDALFIPSHSRNIVRPRTNTFIMCVSPTSLDRTAGEYVSLSDFGILYDYERGREEEAGDVTDDFLTFLENNQPILVEDLSYMPDLLDRL